MPTQCSGVHIEGVIVLLLILVFVEVVVIRVADLLRLLLVWVLRDVSVCPQVHCNQSEEHFHQRAAGARHDGLTQQQRLNHRQLETLQPQAFVHRAHPCTLIVTVVKDRWLDCEQQHLQVFIR